MFTQQEKQALFDAIGGIESGLVRIADNIPDFSSENFDYSMQIYQHGDKISVAIEHVATALEHIAEAIGSK